MPVVADIADLPDDAHRPRVRVHARRRPTPTSSGPAPRRASGPPSSRRPATARRARRASGCRPSWWRWPTSSGMLVAGPERPGRRVHAGAACARRSWRRTRRPGGIGIASQSGNFVSSFLNYAVQTGVGVSRAVSAGNAAAVTIPDYLEFYARRRRHRRRRSPTSRACRTAARSSSGPAPWRPRKPLVLVKGGATAGGQRAAASHTGLAGQRRPGVRRHVPAGRASPAPPRSRRPTRRPPPSPPSRSRRATASSCSPPPAAGASSPPTPSARIVARAHAAARRPAGRARREAPAALEPQQPGRPRRRRDPRHDPRGDRPHRRPPRRRRGDLPRPRHPVEPGRAHAQRAASTRTTASSGSSTTTSARTPGSPQAAAEASERYDKPVLTATELAVTHPDNAGPVAVRATGRALLPVRQPRRGRPRPPLALRPPPEGPRPDVRHPRWWLLLAVPAVVLLVGAAMAQRDTKRRDAPGGERWWRHPGRHDHVCRAAACVAVHDHPARRRAPPGRPGGDRGAAPGRLLPRGGGARVPLQPPGGGAPRARVDA